MWRKVLSKVSLYCDSGQTVAVNQLKSSATPIQKVHSVLSYLLDIDLQNGKKIKQSCFADCLRKTNLSEVTDTQTKSNCFKNRSL